jgi:hypothetical protein
MYYIGLNKVARIADASAIYGARLVLTTTTKGKSKMDYNKQATDFLAKYNLDLVINKEGTGKYWPDDTEKRDIYAWTLANRSAYPIRSTSGRFGQSLADTGKRKPTAYDILACLCKYDPETFQDFCDSYGYDTDSRKALEIYLSVQEEHNGLRKVIPSDAWSEFQEIS